ncbi:DNA-binding transcriptional regulator, ArsR family [Paraoerskovia marina]|uniref:DNA-binding transcriptional regulator, ArsR family n=1 Tax=Paraoerskovia marina TaxID=545619 RepID=A0A1H1MVD0_9CELL|nr:metalloregulator ArsR/SmtB family transcription factor [Paraoerskovia marina]SDR90640.1 DNA-binding transcriptional regulator, ArsR family [Paraoerskovia marina]
MHDNPELYRALADPTRRAILDELVRRDMTLFAVCSHLATEHGVTSSRQAISQHLRVLADSGLVTSTKVGRTTVHRLDPTPLRSVAQRWLRTDSPDRTT